MTTDKAAQVFDRLFAMLAERDELGDANREQFCMTLYGIENKPAVISDLKARIHAITTNCKVIVLDPAGEFTNVKILDIEL